MATVNLDELRLTILAAAEERFRTYGYNKTTMVEIAQDCGCSAANLYRYFPSKQDIAEAVSLRCMNDRVDALREVIRQPNASAEQRLRSYVTQNLKYTQEIYADSPKIIELVAYMLEQRQGLVHEKIRAQCSLIAEILAYGNETGEFVINDVITTAQTVYAALTAYDVPIFHTLYSPEEFEEMASNTVDLLLKGLARRE